MTAVVVLKTASRQVWLKHRRAGLGGTDVAAVLGLNRYATPLDVWLNKTGRMWAADDSESYPMRRGRWMEKLLLAEYAANHPGVILDKPPALLAHPELPWLRASLDHLAHDRDETRVVEVKTAGWRARDAWWDPEVLIPDSYAVQVLTYLAVTGLDAADVVADIAGDLVELQIRRDPVWEGETLPYLEAWWQRHVVADVAPPVDPDRDTLPALGRAWVPDPGETMIVPAGDELLEDIARARADRAIAKTAGERYDRGRVQIRAAMKTAARITTDQHVTVARIDGRGTLTLPTPKEPPNV